MKWLAKPISKLKKKKLMNSSKTCRYGSGCRNDACSFSHPSGKSSYLIPKTNLTYKQKGYQIVDKKGYDDFCNKQASCSHRSTYRHEFNSDGDYIRRCSNCLKDMGCGNIYDKN